MILILLLKIVLFIPLILLFNDIDQCNKLNKFDKTFLITSSIANVLSLFLLLVFVKIGIIVQMFSSVGYLILYSKIKEIIYVEEIEKKYKRAMLLNYSLHTILVALVFFGLEIVLLSVYVLFDEGQEIILFFASFILIVIYSYTFTYSILWIKKKRKLNILNKMHSKELFGNNSVLFNEDMFEDEIIDTIELNNYSFNEIKGIKDTLNLYDGIKSTLDINEDTSIIEEIEELFD